jgi:hypothetical protein
LDELAAPAVRGFDILHGGGGGKAFQERIYYWDNNDGRGQRKKIIAPSEYGIVLVDLKTKGKEKPQLWQCNDYSNFGSLMYAPAVQGYGSTIHALAAELLERKQYTKVDFDFSGSRRATEQEINAVIKIARTYAAVKGYQDPRAEVLQRMDSPRCLIICTSHAKVERHSVHETTCPERMRSMTAWLKKRDWKVKTCKTWR